MEPKSGPTWLGPPTLRLSESRCPNRVLSAAGARGHQAFEGDPVSVVAAIKRATWTQVRASVPYKAKGSRLFTGEGRLRVNNGCAGRSPDSSAVPRIADDLVRPASRQRWAMNRPIGPPVGETDRSLKRQPHTGNNAVDPRLPSAGRYPRVMRAPYRVRCRANSSADCRLAPISFSIEASILLISTRRSSWDFSVSR
jgi:hypothetical protein